jgi:hypothetical protein
MHTCQLLKISMGDFMRDNIFLEGNFAAFCRVIAFHKQLNSWKFICFFIYLSFILMCLSINPLFQMKSRIKYITLFSYIKSIFKISTNNKYYGIAAQKALSSATQLENRTSALLTSTK